jgi:hypothetical protein
MWTMWVTVTCSQAFHWASIRRILEEAETNGLCASTRRPTRGLSLGGAVPLSEHEQRMLDEIERALENEDPKFANTVRQTNPQIHYKRRIVKAVIGFLVGVGLLMGGVIANNPVGYGVGAVGFLVMLACTLWGLSTWRRIAGGVAEAEPAASDKQQRRQGMMDRFEERWRRRQEGDS